MAGSIRRRGSNAWQIQITVGTDPVTGSGAEYKTVHGTGVMQNAQQLLLSPSPAQRRSH